MKSLYIKFLVSVFILIVFFISGVFYIVYIETESILLSLIASGVGYILWKFIFGGGLKKRTGYVDILLSKKFPVSDEDPLMEANTMLSKSWVNGNGYTDEVDQPMCLKVNENGIAMFYLCRATEKPFVIPWGRLSQISVLNACNNRGNRMARLLIPGVGMRIIVPWDKKFNEFVPDRILFNEGE